MQSKNRMNGPKKKKKIAKPKRSEVFLAPSPFGLKIIMANLWPVIFT